MPKYIQDPGDFRIALPVLAHLMAAVGGLQAWVMRSIATSTQQAVVFKLFRQTCRSHSPTETREW